MSGQMKLPFYPCEHCGAQTQIMYKEAANNTPTGSVDHWVCMDCLEKFLNDAVLKSPARWTPHQESQKGFQTSSQFLMPDYAIAINLEWAELRIMNIGCQRNYYPSMASNVFAVILRSLYNGQYHVKIFHPMFRDDIVSIACQILRLEYFVNNSYPEDMV